MIHNKLKFVLFGRTIFQNGPFTCKVDSILTHVLPYNA